MSETSEYEIWCDVKKRCTNSHHKDWKYYGGRGITMCERWLNSFENFLVDVGPRPSLKHSIDRWPDFNGNYEPGNVRWATHYEQMNNCRRVKWVEFQGQRMSMKQCAPLVGMSYSDFRADVRDGYQIEGVTVLGSLGPLV